MNPDARIRLEDLLDREIELARALEGILAQEKAALTGNSAQAVTQLAAEKTQLLARIEALEAERRSLCAQPNASGLAASIGARWRALLGLMAGCRSANEVNGHIIRVRQNQIRQLIDIIRGGPAAVTYDPRGKTFARALRALGRV